MFREEIRAFLGKHTQYTCLVATPTSIIAPADAGANIRRGVVGAGALAIYDQWVQGPLI